MISQKVIIRINSIETSKLGFIKVIKDATGMGLKESKDFADDLFYKFEISNNTFASSRQIVLLDNYTENDLRKNLSFLSARYEVIGRNWERQIKLLSLGIGDGVDYKEFISDYMSYDLYGKSVDDINIKMNDLLSGLSTEDMEKVYNKLIKRD